MERVAARRGVEGACLVSSPFYEVGTRVLVYGANTDRALACVVADVSRPEHRAGHIERKRVAELGFNEARALCGTQAMRERPEQCPIVVIKF